MSRLSTGKCWACGKPIERGLILCDDCEPACEFCGAATAEECHCADGRDLTNNDQCGYDAEMDAMWRGVDGYIAVSVRDAGARDGQATVRLALAFAPVVALVIAFGLIAAAVWGAAWIDGAWLAPFAGLAR